MNNEIIVGLWSIYQKPQRKPKTLKQRLAGKYVKPYELTMFETEYNIHAYDDLQRVPEYARVRTRFRDDTANELTKAILAHLKYTGNFGARVNTTGVYDSRTGQYRQTNARKAGKASGKARKERSTLRAAFKELLALKTKDPEKPAKQITGAERLALAIYDKATHGDTKACKLIAEITGEYKQEIQAEVHTTGERQGMSPAEAAAFLRELEKEI